MRDRGLSSCVALDENLHYVNQSYIKDALKKKKAVVKPQLLFTGVSAAKCLREIEASVSAI